MLELKITLVFQEKIDGKWNGIYGKKLVRAFRIWAQSSSSFELINCEPEFRFEPRALA